MLLVVVILPAVEHPLSRVQILRQLLRRGDGQVRAGMIPQESVAHALATAASDTVKVAKFVEQSVLPALKKAQADSSTIEAVTALVSPQAANIERVGFAVIGVVIKAIDDAGAAAGANGLNLSLDAQLVADIKSIASAVKGALPVSAAK
jgi:hypothetical protein